MTDIVKRLWDWVEEKAYLPGHRTGELMREAADTITTLRARLAEVTRERDELNETLAEELAETLETFRLLGLTDEASFACDTATKAINRRIEELQADARVLADEVEAKRERHTADVVLYNAAYEGDETADEARDGYARAVAADLAATAATDASGALKRHGQKKEDNTNAK